MRARSDQRGTRRWQEVEERLWEPSPPTLQGRLWLGLASLPQLSAGHLQQSLGFRQPCPRPSPHGPTHSA